MEEIRVDTTLEAPLSVQDQAMFDRVWQRVMSQQQPESPSDERHLPAPVSVPETTAAALGPTSQEYAVLLQQRLNDVHTSWHAYQSLARRTQNMTARQLRALAADQQQSLRQLGAAHFLLTGNWFHPCPQAPLPTGPIPHSLREMFLWEQRCMEAFRRGGCVIRDSYIKNLFGQLEEKAEFHQNAIRRMLEGLHT